MSHSSINSYLVGGSPLDQLRAINHEYQVGVIARSSQQMADYQRASLELQSEAAATNARAQADSAHRQEEANRNLRAIKKAIRAIERSLQSVSDQLFEQQQTLESIADILQRPYEVKALELRREADKWLTSGMNNTGRERDEDWKDATRLLQAATNNPVGMQDYVAWFQIGWLQWKHEQNIAQAEQSFYRAMRLSASNKDLYHIKSVRHLAYMHYLQNNFQDAYLTIKKAPVAGLDQVTLHDTMYDAARYSAKIGNDKEALGLLSKCIDLRPTTIITMYSEVDFQ